MTFDFFELEPLIINLFLKDHIFYLKIKDVMNKDYFSNKKIGEIFELFYKFDVKYNKLPTKETLINLFQKKYINKDIQEYADAINMIYDYDKEYDNTYIIDNTINFIKQARVVEAIKRSIPLIEEGKYDTIVEDIKKSVNVNFDKDLGRFLIKDSINTLKECENERISTGYKQLDISLNGGFEPSCLYIFSGIYGIGKSIWLQNIAVKQMELDRDVLFYTLELSEKVCTRRLLSMFAKIKSTELNVKMEELTKNFDILRTYSKSDILIKEYPTGTASANTLRAHINETIHVLGHKPKLIFVDYTKIMSPITHISAENTYSRLNAICEELRALAQELKLPIITAAQINREGMDESGGTKKGKMITGQQVADSFGLNMTADVHFVINQTKKEKGDGIMNLYTDKNRQGASNTIMKFKIDYDYLLLKEE